MDRYFTTLAGELDETIRDLYGARIAETRTLLEEDLHQAQAVQARSAELESLESIVLPELRGRLAQIAEEMQA